VKLISPPLSLTACLLLAALPAQAEKLTIAAAADLRFAMPELLAGFKQANPSDELEVIYGSSGKFRTQIEQGAPFDLFFSADISLPRELAKAGLTASEVTPYAVGRLVLWSATLDASTLTLARLADADITRVAIASPKHAPYGKRAMEALEASGLLAKVEPKLVYGESVAQAAQFVQTGNAQVGLIALALALSPELKKKGYALVPENLHQPLEQGFVITRRAKDSALAKRFAAYVSSPAGRTVLERYGFAGPPTAAAQVRASSPSPADAGR